RGISKPLQPGNGDLEVRPIAVVEGQQCAPARQTLRIQKPFEETADIDQLPSILVQIAKLRGKNGFRNIKPASPTAGRRFANLMEAQNRQPSTVELRVHLFVSHSECASFSAPLSRVVYASALSKTAAATFLASKYSSVRCQPFFRSIRRSSSSSPRPTTSSSVWPVSLGRQRNGRKPVLLSSA